MAYKGLSYDYRAINLLKSEQTSDEYAKKNPQLKVPLLVIGEAGDKAVSQSMAIIDYLEHAHPDKPSLMPKDPCRTTRTSRRAATAGASHRQLPELRCSG